MKGEEARRAGEERPARGRPLDADVVPGVIVEAAPPAQLRDSQHPDVRLFLQTWFGKN